MKKDTRLADWAIGRIEAEYRDDVCLLLEHRTLKLDKDAESTAFSYYIPATNRANGLARTFIAEGIGYDLFPMSWERIERMADVKEYNTTCLADAEILWARSDGDRQRFVSLQARLTANLQNPQYMLERAGAWLNTAKEIYRDTLFEDKLHKIREYAGYICDLLSLAVAFANQRYYRHGQTDQIKELKGMKDVPEGFVKLYEGIVMEKCPDTQKRLCHEMINAVQTFLSARGRVGEKPGYLDYSELAAWYQELCYTWRRVYHWCDSNDPVNAYIWCCYLQNEVEEWGSRFGIDELDIFSSFDPEDLAAFKKYAEAVEEGFRRAIEANGVSIDEYETVEDFLRSAK